MKRLLTCLLLSLGLVAGNANARVKVAKFYYGMGFSDGTVDITNAGDRAIGTVTGSVGFQLLDYIGVELAIGLATDEPASILSDPLVNYQAALLKLGYRWDRTALYVLGGQARLDIDSDLSRSDAGIAFGIGLNLFGNETTALNFNYLNLDDGAFSTATIGFQYYFGGFR